YQLVRDHNGKIFVESEAGKGTSISIKLPAGGRVVRADESASSPSPAVVASGAEARNNRQALNSGKRK
ncbi:MAG TPA: ATP-binding protein, partial [Blastocatellia bacterium]|nr:ATP-binding protein [Blastocatellia bacterium]